jgi:hypothetical protein
VLCGEGFEGDAVAEGLELGNSWLASAVGVAADEVVAWKLISAPGSMRGTTIRSRFVWTKTAESSNHSDDFLHESLARDTSRCLSSSSWPLGTPCMLAPQRLPACSWRPAEPSDVVQARSATCWMPACLAQLAQQNMRPSASTPCPMIRQPQCSQVGASAWMAHSKLSKVWVAPATMT